MSVSLLLCAAVEAECTEQQRQNDKHLPFHKGKGIKGACFY